ncbi:MAG: hypothetical protein JXR85_12165, partial [Deltaproteobacteria bacterium]|nr:hypothetical protein [Deltaproteobacteria bacterium]
MRAKNLKMSKRSSWCLRKINPETFVLAIAIILTLMCSSAFADPIWTNPATGKWFTADNWDTLTVPGAGSSPIISNGGTAELAGSGETEMLGSLSVGLGSSGIGVGAVTSTGVKLRTSGAINIGTVFTTGTSASGSLDIDGAGAEAF